uniref:Small ribosomal subunit protein uS17 n=1 Tax=Dermatophagoides pteronyssinus TaxID=6956 RepID=A0A6P6XK67_DERPT|nr:40S ribosomal protein S11-like [Dermatophagoides pteronyssinus]
MVHIEAQEHQVERAYQKQKGVTTLSRKALINSKNIHGKVRWVKQVGFGFKTPFAAIEGRYIDNKCPFTGDVSIRGRILKGMVVSMKMKKTIIIRRHYLHYIPKYKRFEKRHKNLAVHCSPAFELKVGDIVTVGECRPLAKTVCFNVLHVEPKQIFGNPKKQFCLF